MDTGTVRRERGEGSNVRSKEKPGDFAPLYASTSGTPASGVFSAGLIAASFAAEVLPAYISDRELTVVRAISTTLSTRFRSVSLALVTV